MSAHDVLYELLYQVVQPGDENRLVGKTSVIEFPTNKTVAALEEAILQKLGEKLHGKEFDLWMLDPMLAIEEEELLKAIRFPSERLKELDPVNRLSKYWQEAPQDGHLHIVVQLRDSPLVVQHPTSLWQHNTEKLNGIQLLAQFQAEKRGSFLPHDKLLKMNHIVDAHGVSPVLNDAKKELGRIFVLPLLSEQQHQLEPYLQFARQLQNQFPSQKPSNRTVTRKELGHYHAALETHVDMDLDRYREYKEGYFLATYMEIVAAELAERLGLKRVQNSFFLSYAAWVMG
ncbi:hypothetical protein BT69DRAFT_24814 [Atractiella rhizophila]|nr:hypothetical protein BT69DRAFT_24814 [Atractiella rhizophila]